MGLASGDPGAHRILVVDDDEDILVLLEKVVTNEGFQVDTAASGKQALEKIIANPPSLVLLDLMLPDMGGYEVLRQLQAQDATVRIPVIIVTGRMMDKSTVETFSSEVNVTKFLAKPIRPSVLAGYLHAILATTPRSKPKAG